MNNKCNGWGGKSSMGEVGEKCTNPNCSRHKGYPKNKKKPQKDTVESGGKVAKVLRMAKKMPGKKIGTTSNGKAIRRAYTNMNDLGIDHD